MCFGGLALLPPLFGPELQTCGTGNWSDMTFWAIADWILRAQPKPEVASVGGPHQAPVRPPLQVPLDCESGFNH